MDINTVLNFIKLPKQVYFIALIISGCLLFGDVAFTKKLALDQFKNEYNLWIGIVFLISLAFSSIGMIEIIYSKVQEHLKEQQMKRVRLETISKLKNTTHSLDVHELSVVREFYIQKKCTIEMSIEDSTVVGLINKKVLSQVGSQGYKSNMTDTICYFKLNSVSKEILDEIDFNEIKENKRPYWISQLKARQALGNRITEVLDRM